MSNFPVIKQELESDIEEIGDESSDSGAELVDQEPTLTTNYHDTRLPMLEDFGGPYNFSYRLPKEGSSAIKPTWECSIENEQVFIKMDRVLVVQFSFDASQLNVDDVFIRAVLVYSSADHVFTPVNRCAVHLIEDDPLSNSHSEDDVCFCPDYKLAGHVVRCKSNDAIYCYDPKSQRHSVLCPVRTSHDILYSFSCKNSCPRGMHRRSTKLVFTLENSCGKMLGRASMDIKICSCPRRDRERMEHGLKPHQISNSSMEIGHTVSTGGSSDPSSQGNKRPRMSSPVQKMIDCRNLVEVEMYFGDEEEDNEQSSHIPGEVIMQIRSEVRNIRQALAVIERRFTKIQELLNEQNET